MISDIGIGLFSVDEVKVHESWILIVIGLTTHESWAMMEPTK